MVTPPTLKAASPVGAAIAHSKSSDSHILVTRALIASIRKDFPVPPTPLTKNLRGLRSHEHSWVSWDFRCQRWVLMWSKTRLWSWFNMETLSSNVSWSDELTFMSKTSVIAVLASPNSWGSLSSSTSFSSGSLACLASLMPFTFDAAANIVFSLAWWLELWLLSSLWNACSAVSLLRIKLLSFLNGEKSSTRE